MKDNLPSMENLVRAINMLTTVVDGILDELDRINERLDSLNEEEK